MADHARCASLCGVIDLYWIPLGAGGHCVRHCGAALSGPLASRHAGGGAAARLYHAALVVESDGDRYAIELAPSPDGAAVPRAASWGRARSEAD